MARKETKIMEHLEYEEIELMKQSENNTVHLICNEFKLGMP